MNPPSSESSAARRCDRYGCEQVAVVHDAEGRWCDDHDPGSSSGRTPGFGPGDAGSSPAPGVESDEIKASPVAERGPDSDAGLASDSSSAAPVHARTYDQHSGGHDHDGSVAELHWPDGRVVQISGATDEDERGGHVLIRVWPKNGTAEYGGGNITSFSMLLRPEGDEWTVHSLHIDGRYLPHYRTEADA